MARRIEEDFEEVFEDTLAEEEYEDELEIDLENDEISPEEEGFMRGARDASDY